MTSDSFISISNAFHCLFLWQKKIKTYAIFFFFFDQVGLFYFFLPSPLGFNNCIQLPSIVADVSSAPAPPFLSFLSLSIYQRGPVGCAQLLVSTRVLCVILHYHTNDALHSPDMYRIHVHIVRYLTDSAHSSLAVSPVGTFFFLSSIEIYIPATQRERGLPLVAAGYLVYIDRWTKESEPALTRKFLRVGP